ncbi:unnamed protein product [Sphagnum balticum]
MEKVIRKYKGHKCIVHAVASPKRTLDTIASVGDDGQIKIWEQRSKQEGNEKGLLKGGWSRDGLYICCGSIDKCVYIWDTTTKKIVQKLGGHTGTVNQAAMAAGNWLASCSNDKSIIVSELPDIFL